MQNETIFVLILSILVGIIGYFLIQTMVRINNNEKNTNENTTNIALMKQEHELKYAYVIEDSKELREAIRELVKEMKELNGKIK